MRLLWMMNVVMCHIMMNTHMAQPRSIMLTKLILPRYSGARKSDEAPKWEAKLPVTVRNRMSQKMSNTWYLRKCSSTSWTGRK